ncbi:5-formyltetrahydrofolate cyclo-ligase [Seonamhaeicola algicola]|uniref:5-formyltetrahydrofolate cyclo-ligase n=1 Tax=Seonamhaeicola algicola TaxID=1719036 RepID=A0A5C7AYH2_9FLAO|nr:5-formyltetrahydrofolate cyclo-ligase [Seonamhaeicola algicola]TXE13174.1 5-formyltetrahydrofolate cyclo-ligase [Seonamhaeicola algicola]
MTKTELRKKYKTLRNNLSQNDIETFSIAIANNAIKMPIWQHKFYHIFLPIEEQKEINTEFILSILAGKDKNIVVPKSHFDTGEMTHFLLTDGTTIKKNHYNIPEPVDGIEIDDNKIDVVFIPLLSFDKKGNRVGYGKGFYDRFLAKCKPETIKIGLSFFDAETQIEDTYSTDIKLDFCVTKSHVYTFK